MKLLSFLSAAVVISTAFVGISIYAQSADDSDFTTLEEEDKSEQETTASGSSNNSTQNATADDSEATTLAEVRLLFDGLVACNIGTAQINAPENETRIAESLNASRAPTVSVTVMTETEIADAAANETETASSEPQIASANCFSFGSASTANTTSTANVTNDVMGNATTFAANTTSTNTTTMTNATGTASNATSIANTTTTASDSEILVIDGQDFAPGQVVLMFSSNALVGIDDVDPTGDIESKVPAAQLSNELEFVESGTTRTATFSFDGQTLIAAKAGDIPAEGAQGESLPPAVPLPGNMTNSTNSKGTTNSTMQ